MPAALWIAIIALAVPVWAYAGYPLALFLLAALVQIGRDAAYLLFRGERRRTGRPLPRVSVILAAYNEEEGIESTLQHCVSLDYPSDRIEVLVGSDGSADRTVAVAKRFENSGVRVFDFSERRGKAAVIADCFAKARGEILVFSDANTRLRRDAVRNLVRHFTEPTIGAVCGELRFETPDGRPADEGLYWRYEQTLKLLESRLDSTLGANGAIYAIRRDLFPKLPPDTVTDDFVVVMSARSKGFRVVYDPEAVATEDLPASGSSEFRRRVRIGAGNWQALWRCADLLLPWKGFVSVAFWSHKVARWFTPFLLVVAVAASLATLHEPLGRKLLLVQAVGYGCALLGLALDRLRLPAGPFRLVGYFATINAALGLGMLKGVFGRQRAAWRRTDRKAPAGRASREAK